MFLFLATLLATFALRDALAFDNSRYDNVAVYWGQNSYGATHSSDTENFQKTLAHYCNDNAIDVFPLAFVTSFFSTGGLPSLNLANTCNPTGNATFPGTSLPNCAALAYDIQYCQSKGKIITISLGGAIGSVGFSSDAQARQFAQNIWNIFLGGTSFTRPFGSAVLDGVDLDIEGGSSTYYATFINTIRSLSSGASKKYYITGAPQCVYPDASLGDVLNTASFDAIYVHKLELEQYTLTLSKCRFYNNPCGLQAYSSPSDWNFGLWDNWARTTSPNPNVKVYIGAPASSMAAGTGYVDTAATLQSIATTMRNSFPSFGGVMLWDASQAHANNRCDLSTKNALTAAGGTAFIFPACTAAAYVPGSSYVANSQVSYGGYIWVAKCWTNATPANNPNSEWNAISACGGSVASPSTTPTTTVSLTTITTPTSSSGSCAGVSAWSSTVAYVGGEKVTYNGHLWTSEWWTQNDVPGGAAGVWIEGGAC